MVVDGAIGRGECMLCTYCEGLFMRKDDILMDVTVR